MVFGNWIVVASILRKIYCFSVGFVRVCFLVFVSVLGHMVDALASGADEGRGGCDMPRGVVNRALIRGCPNGETRHE